MATNEFLPFCPTDTGSNLLSEADYTAAADRVTGNKPGIASAKLVNKALRQSSAIAAQFAQFVSNKTGADILDDSVAAKLLAQLTASLTTYAPNVTKYNTGTGTWNATFYFNIATGSATTGATYTNNGVTFTIVATVASALLVRASGSAVPTASGTLTKTSGTGDTTLTFYAYRAPLYLGLMVSGAGGGGGGSGISGTGGAGSTGATSSFGSLVSCTGGVGGLPAGGVGGAGGVPTVTGVLGTGVVGGSGTGAAVSVTAFQTFPGGGGGSNPLGGAGGGGAYNTVGLTGQGNTGGGGGGAGCPNVGGTDARSGSGGGSGGFFNGIVSSIIYTASYAVGASSTAGAAGSSGFLGGAGGAGVVQVTEYYQ